jgi:hypothetical protein
MYEYDPDKVSMSRLRLAYALNDHFTEIVMAGLWPHALFPLDIWRYTHGLFWRGFADTAVSFYSIKIPEFPEHNVTKEKYFHAHLYAQDIENLFSMLASRIHVNALREGLRYIVSMTYENADEFVFQGQTDSLFERLSMVEENNNYTFTQHLQKEKFIALMEEKIFSIPPSWYFFISKMYQDTILVDTVSAIRKLHFLNIPFKIEVKGIIRALVESVHKELAEESARMASTTKPKEQDIPPPSTGSRKDTKRINATRQACIEVVKELLIERQAFENDKNTWQPNILGLNGKTNWKIFERMVAKRLGTKPHIETARAEWKHVPGTFKHDGRMPEQ